MADPDFTLLQELDALAAASLNTPMASIENAINDLELDAFADGAFRQEHLPSLIPAPGAQIVNIDGTTLHTYNNLFPGTGTSTVVGIGPGAGTGWRVISDGTTDLSVDLAPGSDVDMDSAARIAGILVLVNIELQGISTGAAPDEDHSAAFCVAVRDGVGTWTVLPHTERFESSIVVAAGYLPPARDVPIATLMHQGLPDVAGSVMLGLDIMVSFMDRSGGAPATPAVNLRRATLIVIPFHARDVA